MKGLYEYIQYYYLYTLRNNLNQEKEAMEALDHANIKDEQEAIMQDIEDNLNKKPAAKDHDEEEADENFKLEV